MKKLFKILGYILLTLIVLIVGTIGYVKIALPNVGAAPELKVERTPERIERGRYLANCVNSCMDCHSKRDWTKFAGPLIEGTLGQGGEKFDQQYGFPGSYYSRNITPDGIGSYTDGELYRAITTGVTKEGRAMFPVMPYPYYGKMDPEDIKSIIAYLRTLQPIHNQVPASASDFPMSIIINLIPKAAKPGKRPDTMQRLANGAYLTNAAGCIECHTQAKQGQILPELAFSGGRAFPLPGGGRAYSANITADVKTGIGSWTKEAFVSRFKAYADSGYRPQPVAAGGYNTIMPWGMYSKMTRSDLTAIYTYLRSLPAKENLVTKFVPGK